MKEFFKDILNDNVTKFGFLTSIIFIPFGLIIVLLFYKNLPPFIPTFNQLPWGEQRLGNTYTIFAPLLIALIIFISNITAASFMYKKIPIASRMLSITSLLSSLLILIFILKTVFELI